jgi:hypothetical protein
MEYLLFIWYFWALLVMQGLPQPTNKATAKHGTKLGPFHISHPLTGRISSMADILVPIAPLVYAGASMFPAFHILREFAKVVLKPIVPLPSKTIPQHAQTTASTPSTTFEDDGRWFPTSLFANVPAPDFTPEPTPFVNEPMLPPPAAPTKTLEHLPDVLSSNSARFMMVFLFTVITYMFIQFFARHIQLRRRFSPVTHIVSTTIAIYIYTIVGPASHYALLDRPVTLEQAKESALPVACATLAAFSVFNTLVSVVESVFRNVLAGIRVSIAPENVRLAFHLHAPAQTFI